MVFVEMMVGKGTAAAGMGMVKARRVERFERDRFEMEKVSNAN